MGRQAIVYGRIQEDWEGSAVRRPETPEYNQCVLESLPDEDDRWPFLTRHMFAVAHRAYQGNADRGEYRGRIVHFAASFKDDPDDPDWPMMFLAKLERLLLSRLLWRSAKVHFESTVFAERVFQYESDAATQASLRQALAESRFGERFDVAAGWERRELPGTTTREGRFLW